MKKIISITVTVVLVALIAANLYVLVVKSTTDKLQPAVFGWSVAVVISGSMEDAVSVNDLIIVHRQENYNQGDIITFESGHSVVTHRIVEVRSDGYQTKGDANNAPDMEIVPPENVIGKVVITISALGTLIGYMQTPLGMSILAAVGLLAAAWPTIFRKR